MTIRISPINVPSYDHLFSDRFSRIDKLFSQLIGENPISLAPPYNLRQITEEHFELTISLPGWKKNELEIEKLGDRLTVSGKLEETKTVSSQEKPIAVSVDTNWLHQGIQRANFQLNYSIPGNMQVMMAKLEDGILNIRLLMEIPKSEKPQRVQIENSEQKVIKQQES